MAVPLQGRRPVEDQTHRIRLRDGDGDPPANVLAIRTYPANESQIPVSRDAAGDTVADHPTFDAHTALLLLSELATNAVKHSRSPAFTVAMALTSRGRLLVAVVDGGHGESKPHLREAGLADDGGRGLLLVEAFAHRWGAVREDGGMMVWFELAAEPDRAQEYASATPPPRWPSLSKGPQMTDTRHIQPGADGEQVTVPPARLTSSALRIELPDGLKANVCEELAGLSQRCIAGFSDDRPVSASLLRSRLTNALTGAPPVLAVARDGREVTGSVRRAPPGGQ